MKLLKYLNDHNISQTDFAEKIGVHFSYITHLIKGRRTPSLSTALRIERATCGAVPVTVWVENKLSGVKKNEV
jgi:plasmid maintenance system antidote protein VapI